MIKSPVRVETMHPSHSLRLSHGFLKHLQYQCVCETVYLLMNNVVCSSSLLSPPRCSLARCFCWRCVFATFIIIIVSIIIISIIISIIIIINSTSQMFSGTVLWLAMCLCNLHSRQLGSYSLHPPLCTWSMF